MRIPQSKKASLVAMPVEPRPSQITKLIRATLVHISLFIDEKVGTCEALKTQSEKKTNSNLANCMTFFGKEFRHHMNT